MSQNCFGKITGSYFSSTKNGRKHRIDLTIQVNNPQNFWDRTDEIHLCVFAEDGFENLYQSIMNCAHPFEHGIHINGAVKNALVGSFWGFSIDRLEHTFDGTKSYRTYKLNIHDDKPMSPCASDRYEFDRSNVGEWKKQNGRFEPMNEVALAKANANKSANCAGNNKTIE